MLQIALRPAVELSYLRKEEQADLFSIMDEMDCTPSHAQAIKMRQMSEAKTGEERLSKDAMTVIMEEEKGNQKEQFKIPKERISKYFAPGTPAQRIEDTIIKALEAVPQAPAQFRTITPLTREKCAHLQGNGGFCRFPLSTPHPFRQPKQPKKEDISRGSVYRKPWRASFPQMYGWLCERADKRQRFGRASLF